MALNVDHLETLTSVVACWGGGRVHYFQCYRNSVGSDFLSGAAETFNTFISFEAYGTILWLS